MVGPSHADPHTTFINSIASASNSPYRIPHLTVDSFALSLRIVERTDSFSFAFSRYAAAPEFDETFRVWHAWSPVPPIDRKSVVEGTSVSVRVDLGGRRPI